MRTFQMDDTPFDGRTSRMPTPLERKPLDCRHCGSSLAGRREGRRFETVAGSYYQVDVYRCACGRGRHQRRVVEGVYAAA